MKGTIINTMKQSGVVRGRVNAKYNVKRQTWRFRFSGVRPEQAQIIRMALDKARAEQGTQYDEQAK